MNKRIKHTTTIVEKCIHFSLGLILLFFGVYSVKFFTGFWPQDYAKHDLHETDIATIISGLTAPFFGLFGSLILFVTFRRQTDANITLKEEINKENYFKSYDEILRSIDCTKKYFNDCDIKSFNFDGIFRFINFENQNTFDKVIDFDLKSNKSYSTLFDELYTFIRLFEETTQSIEVFHDPIDDFNFCKSESEFNFKRILRLNASTLFHSEVKPIITRILEVKHRNKQFNNLYKSADTLYKRFSLNNSKFLGCQTQVLSLNIPMFKNKKIFIDFSINEPPNELRETENKISITINGSKHCWFKKIYYKLNPRRIYYKTHVGIYVSHLELAVASIHLQIKKKTTKQLSSTNPTFDLKPGNNYLNAKIVYPRNKITYCLINIKKTKKQTTLVQEIALILQKVI